MLWCAVNSVRQKCSEWPCWPLWTISRQDRLRCFFFVFEPAAKLCGRSHGRMQRGWLGPATASAWSAAAEWSRSALQLLKLTCTCIVSGPVTFAASFTWENERGTCVSQPVAWAGIHPVAFIKNNVFFRKAVSPRSKKNFKHGRGSGSEISGTLQWG